MRVIAGEARGTRLARPAGGTRPVSDRAREGLFSSLGQLVRGARCLDLFAGTGAVGIEALSRGAKSAEFVDDSVAAVRVIKENLRRTGLEDRARVVKADAGRFLKRPGEPYELVFADPPYAATAGPLREVLSAAGTRLVPEGILVLTRGSRSSMDVIPVNFGIVRRLSYGDTVVLVCREER